MLAEKLFEILFALEKTKTRMSHWSQCFWCKNEQLIYKFLLASPADKRKRKQYKCPPA